METVVGKDHLGRYESVQMWDLTGARVLEFDAVPQDQVDATDSTMGRMPLSRNLFTQETLYTSTPAVPSQPPSTPKGHQCYDSF